MAELQVTVNPYHRSVSINGEEVIQRIIPFPDWFNSLASITCDYDDVLKKITDVANVHRYVSHYVEKQYYFKHLPDYIDWFYAEKEAQAAALAAKKAKWDALQAKLVEIQQYIENFEEYIQYIENNINGEDISVKVPDTTTDRTLADRFAETINVKDYGAVGDGVTDDSAAFQAAIAAAKAKNAILYIPVGNYLVNTLPDIAAYGSGNVIVPNTETEENDTYAAFELLLKFFKVQGAGTAYIYNGTIDFDDEEQVQEILDNTTVGQLIIHDCCPNAPGNDPVYLNNLYNTEEILTESGTYTVKVTGWYKVIVVSGGDGAYAWKRSSGFIDQVSGGAGGRIETHLRYYTKGQQIPVTIGAGGLASLLIRDSLDSQEQHNGGNTIFGDITVYRGGNNVSLVPMGFYSGQGDAISAGGTGIDNIAKFPTYALVKSDGSNFHIASLDAPTYGGGGAVWVRYTAGSITEATEDKLLWAIGDGKQGCVKLHYYDPAKDTNISIDTATAATIADLQSQIAALTARVEELENE